MSICAKDGKDSFLTKRKKPKWDWPGMPSGEELTLFAFQGFGMGPAQARDCWKEAGTLRAFCDLMPEDLKRIKGIGPGKADKITMILDMPWRER
jgi:ERCC4-type nuclease